MHADKPQTYQIILKKAISVFFIILLVLCVYGGVRAIGQEFTNNNHNTQVSKSTKAAAFWESVAGNPQSTAVGNKLARDIRSRINDQHAIEAFQGNSNAYGGVVDDIGFDPFDETGLGCFECGPLSADTVNKVSEIRAGHLDDVLNAIRPALINDGFHLTPFDTSFVGMFFGLWLGICPLCLLAGWFWAYQEDEIDVNFGDLQWQHADSRSKAIATAMAPSWMLIVWFRVYGAQKRAEHKVRDAFPDHMMLIDEVDKSIASLPSSSPEVMQIQELRDKVVTELKSQAQDGTTVNDLELKKCMEYLGGIKDFLEARHDYLATEDTVMSPIQIEKEIASHASR